MTCCIRTREESSRSPFCTKISLYIYALDSLKWTISSVASGSMCVDGNILKCVATIRISRTSIQLRPSIAVLAPSSFVFALEQFGRATD